MREALADRRAILGLQVKILAVDDDPQIRDIFYEMLTRFGYQCSTAADGRQALAILQEERDIHIIIADIRMPGMDGIELIKEIKSRHAQADVISITGYAGDFTFTDVINAGASDFILKPFTENEVQAKLNRVMRERQLRIDSITTSNSLRELNEYLENVIESSVDCIVISDERGFITRVNHAFMKLVGRDRQEIVRHNIHAFAPTVRGMYQSVTGEQVEIDDRFMNELRTNQTRLMQEGKIPNWESYFLRSDGTIVPVEQNIHFLYNDDGARIGAVGVIREISERRKSFKEKARIEERLQNKVTELSIMNEISEVLLSTRELNEILHMILIGATAYQALGFNRAFLFLINAAETVLEGKVATGALSADDAYQIWNSLSHEKHTLRALLKSRQGELSKEDEPINRLVRQMKIVLQGTESIFTRCVHDGTSCNMMNGFENPLVDKNFLRLLGTGDFALVPLASRGKPLGVLLADNFINREVITDEDVERLRAFANHASLAIENSNLYKTLEEKLQELSSAYNELQANRDKLIRYERLSAVGELAAKVTHEIRNPMVAIGGFARRLLKKDLEGEELNRNYLRIIIEEISNLENILTDILYFAKPAEPKCQFVDCNGIIANILEVLAVELEENKISVQCRPAAELPLICIDQNQIRRVIINIIRNAIQAMPDGGPITITSRREDLWLTVEIADTGMGVAEGNIDKLFDAFFSSKATGSGLGLTVSAQIINNHGGTIEVMRGVPKGTVFVIRLPLSSPLQVKNA
jgi:hypothetical protein